MSKKEVQSMLKRLDQIDSGLSEHEKNPVRAQPRSDSGRAVADARELSPLAELIHTLRAEGIRFQIAGMSAAILQAFAFA